MQLLQSGEFPRELAVSKTETEAEKKDLSILANNIAINLVNKIKKS